MNPPSPDRGQTQSYLRELLAERGLHPRASLGQCFLVDLNLLDLLVASGELNDRDFVLEIGAGTGSLTRRLAAAAGHVLAVEIDSHFHTLAQETVQDCANVTLLREDVLENKNTLNPAVIAAIERLAPAESPACRKLVANLPYNVATPLISLLLMSPIEWERFVVTVQKEVADRIVARPGTKDYGSLSVIAQAVAEVSVLRELPPSVFWPRPNVSSAIIRVDPSPARRAAAGDLKSLHHLVRGVMLHRRKNLRGALDGALSDASKSEIDRFLSEHGFDPLCRAEALSVNQFIRLASAWPAAWRERWCWVSRDRSR